MVIVAVLTQSYHMASKDLRSCTLYMTDLLH